MLSSVTRSWESQLGLLSGLILAGLGLALFAGLTHHFSLGFLGFSWKI